MKIIFFLILFFITTSCIQRNNVVFWCGDHPCKNKKEVKAYFEKHMIIEVKPKSEIKKISKDQKSYDVLLKEQNKISKKHKEKQKKSIKTAKKVINKKESKIFKFKKNKDKIKVVDSTENYKDLENFDEIIKFVIEKTKNKPYPDVNDVPG